MTDPLPVVGYDEADIEEFVRAVVEGEYPVYGYVDIQNRLQQGYHPVTDKESAAEAVGADALSVLFTTKFIERPDASVLLDIIEQGR